MRATKRSLQVFYTCKNDSTFAITIFFFVKMGAGRFLKTVVVVVKNSFVVVSSRNIYFVRRMM